MSQARSVLGKSQRVVLLGGPELTSQVRFTLREGGKTIGTGIITKILETA